ncbi:MAG TPA: hypothetical protein VMZ73_07640 [Acidimicrobiales bacterium]|nr:hypothetical protein [Acidimicrobiales bacterium]
MQAGVAVARRASTPVLGVLLALLTWRHMNFLPVDSLDPSWQAALNMVAHDRLPYNRIVFTYGPLGFLAQPEGFYASTMGLSALYVFAVQTSLCSALVSVLRRTLGLPVAGVATFLLVSLGHTVGPINAVVVAVVVAAYGLLRGDHSPRTERVLIAAGGVVAGTHLLVKLNTGVTVFVVGALTAVFLNRRAWQPVAIFVVTAIGSLVAGWLITGNGLSDLVPFFDRSWQVASGYSEAMSIEKPGRLIFYPVAAVVTGLLVVLASKASRTWPVRRRVGLALAGGMWLFAAFKLGFVRHDGHDVDFFGEVLLVGAVLAASIAAPAARMWNTVCAVATAAFVAAHLMASGVTALSRLNPVAELARAGEDISVLASPTRRERAAQQARTNLRSRYYHLTPSIVSVLRGHTIHIRPWESGIAWAYPEFRWQPVPVFQEYSAYTDDLDHIDAAFLRSPDAPERILTQALAIDRRNPDWESPAAMVAIVCHYRELLADHPWQVLGRVANRCGSERSLGVVKARVGETVSVPDTGNRNELVIARIHGLDYSMLYGVRSTLWRAPEVHVRLDGGRRNRLVPGTAADGLIVRAPKERLGFSQPFAPDSANLLRVERDSGIGMNQDLTIEFVAIPVLN